MNQKLKSVNSTVIYILLGVVLAFFINQGLALALGTPMPVVAVESGSMVPTFYRGDILVLQGIPAKDLRVGDIIVFGPEGKSVPVVHRIVEINPDGTFQTKGDANIKQLSFEKRITPGQIYGKEVLIIPYLGWVKIIASEYIFPNILWICIAGIGAYLIVFELPKRRPFNRF